ncbi:hypothetical protein HDV00_001729, partial [Rhizophlyctis rosea]
MHRVLPIPQARVPICKFHDLEFGLDCDINVGNKLGLHNSRLLRMYTHLDRRVKPLIMLVKWWAKRRGVNDSASGTISSYAYSLMMLNFLQVRGIIPSLQAVCTDVERQYVLEPLPSREGEVQATGPGKDETASTATATPAPVSADNGDEEMLDVRDGEVADMPGVERMNLDEDDDTASVMDEDPTVLNITPEGFIRRDVTFLSDLTHPSLYNYGESYPPSPSSSSASPSPTTNPFRGPEGVVSLFYQFMRYWGWDFPYRGTDVVSIREGKVIEGGTVALRRWKGRQGFVMVVEDPFQEERNCVGGVRSVVEILKEIRRVVG